MVLDVHLTLTGKLKTPYEMKPTLLRRLKPRNPIKAHEGGGGEN